jgi:hypothetical protein
MTTAIKKPRKKADYPQQRWAHDGVEHWDLTAPKYGEKEVGKASIQRTATQQKRIVVRGMLIVGPGSDRNHHDALLAIDEEFQGHIVAENFDWFRHPVTVRYWITDTRKTKEELEEDTVRQMSGDMEGQYGHDLIAEFRSHLGKYLYLEVDYEEERFVSWK